MSVEFPMLEPVLDVPELSDEIGARRLQSRIEAYWAERGHFVQIRIEPKGFTSQMRAARFDVRSDMLNGLPRPAAIADRRAA